MQVTVFTPHNVKALLLTIIVELLVLALFREKKFIIYFVLIVVNYITNLTMNVLLSIYYEYYSLLLVLCEIFVVIVEGTIYSLFYKNLSKGVKLAFLANLVSWVVSYFIIF